jgi:DNA-binding transcriptional MerR regulator
MRPLKSNTFSIGDTARMTGASQKQIRHWEARGYIPKAARSVCGERAYRRFTAEQVQAIKTIKERLKEGFTLAHAARAARQSNRKEDI